MFYDRLNKWRSRGSGELVAAGVIYGALYLDDWAILGVGGPEGDEFMPVLVQANKFYDITLGSSVFVLSLVTHTPRCVKDLYEFHEGHMEVNHNQRLHSMSADDRDRRTYICQTRLTERLGTTGPVWSDGGQGFAELIKGLEAIHGAHLERMAGTTSATVAEALRTTDDHHSNVSKAKAELGLDSMPQPIRSFAALPTPGMVVQNLTENAQAVLNGFKELEDNLEQMLKDKDILNPALREEFRKHHLTLYLADALHPAKTVTVTL